MSTDSPESKESLVNERRSNLAATKKMLLEQRLRNGAKAAATSAPIPPRDPAAEIPLSFAQQRLWFLDQLNPGGTAYTIPLALRLQGDLPPGAFEAVFTALVARHESLRTVIDFADDQPIQVILPPAPVEIPVIDLSQLTPAEQDQAVQDHLRRQLDTPFDLATGPLLRVVNLLLGAQDQVLIIAMHHIISDGWSVSVLLREIGILSQTIGSGGPDPLPPLPIQYADYAVWERKWMSGPRHQAQLDYWAGQLADCPPLDLPLDYPRPPVQSMSGAAHPMSIPAEIVAGLTELGQTTGTTLFMGLLAAFQVLLSQWSGQKDIAVATPVAHRSRPELAPLIGMLVNTLVLRSEIDQALTFRELLAQVRQTTLAAFSNQEIPFEQVVQAVPVERDQSRPPLAQVMLGMQHASGDAISVPGLTMTPLHLPVSTAKFELNVSFVSRNGELQGGIEYSTALFAPATVARLAEQFLQVLRTLVAQPDVRLDALSWLTPEEQCSLAAASATPWSSPPPATTLPAWLADQAARTPDAVALVCGDERLSYAELHDRAARLAAVLRAAGAGPEARVAICATRSPALVAGILGILAAGAAYVPLDPAYPPARLEWMLRDSAALIVLAEEALVATLPATEAQIILLDAPLPAATPAPPPALDPANLAYLIYTSGSTGRPKGVALTHANVVAFLHWAHAIFPAEVLARTVASTSVCFDLSVFELFGPLTCGGSVLLVPSALELDRLPADANPTLLNTVPSALTSLLSLDALPASLQCINVAGEPLPSALVAQVAARTSARLYNLYGPTEDTTYSTVWLADAGLAGEPPIGRPIMGSVAYVVTAGGQLAPTNQIGEIWLGGAGVARGYWGRPDLTAERFVPDPWSDVPGARAYRTGDRGRYASDGQLRYHGRADGQVKVRGYRIELGEVQTALGRVPGVRDAAAVVHRDQAHGASVVGYVVIEEQSTLDGAAIQAALRALLPAYMVPAAIILLPELPRTPNGKLDRLALPDPFSVAAKADSRPQTPLEVVVAGLWGRILGHSITDRNANFFALGGHSLLATQVIAHTRGQWNISLPLRALFDAPTVASYSALVAATLSASGSQEVYPLEPADRSQPLPLSYAQQRLWFLDQLIPNSTAYNVPLAVRLQGQLPLSAVETVFTLLVERHESLRTTIGFEEGQPIQVIAAPAPVAIPVTDLSALAPSERESSVSRHVSEAANCVFDLAHGPLFRVAALKLAPDDHIILISMHHIITDGWSISVMLREMGTLVQVVTRDLPNPLPPLPIQYADYALWQRRWLAGQVQTQQLAYWIGQLDGAEPLELPLDFPRPAVQNMAGATYEFDLPAPLSAAIKDLGQATETTLFMIALATFCLYLSRWGGQDDIAVATPIANRSLAETENIIGFFVNTLIIRTHIRPDQSFRSLLTDVRETTLAAYAHQDVPFEQVVQALPLDRDQSRPPLAQVMMSLQHAGGAPIALPDLTMTPLKSPATTAKFELSLGIVDRPEGLRAVIDYATALFAAPTIRNLGEQFAATLEAVLASPDAPLQSLFQFAPRKPAAAPKRSASQSGRVARAQPAQAAYVPSARIAVSQPPRDPLERQLVGMCEELLNVRPIGITDDFFALGGHSLMVMQLVARIEKELGVRLTVATVFQKPTVEAIAEEIRDESLESHATMVALRSAGDGPPIFLVHPVGGWVSCYRQLAEKLEVGRPVYAFQSLGLDGAQAPLGDIPTMARRYLAELRALQPAGPYTLGGWSVGGVIAFEMAQQLRAEGQEVDHVLLIDSFTPAANGLANGEEVDETGFLFWFGRDVFGIEPNQYLTDAKAFRQLPGDEQLAILLESIQSAGMLAEDVTLSELRHLLAVFKNNAVAYFSYEPAPYAGALTLFKAAVQVLDGPERPFNGWREFAAGDWAQESVPGDHYTIMYPPHVSVLVGAIAARLG